MDAQEIFDVVLGKLAKLKELGPMGEPFPLNPTADFTRDLSISYLSLTLKKLEQDYKIIEILRRSNLDPEYNTVRDGLRIMMEQEMPFGVSEAAVQCYVIRVLNSFDEFFASRQNNQIKKIRPPAFDEKYVTSVQAISWIAFKDFDALSNHLAKDYQISKFGTTDRDFLRKFVRAMEKKLPLPEDDYPSGFFTVENVGRFVNKCGSIRKFRKELICDVREETRFLRSVMKADTDFINVLCKEAIFMRGIRINGNGHPEPFPLGTLLALQKRGGLRFSLLDNKFFSVEKWVHLQTEKQRLVVLWPKVEVPVKARVGAKPQHDWPVYRKQFDEMIGHYGLPGTDQPELKNQAAVEKKLTEWGEKQYGTAPSPAQMRRHVADWLKEAEAKTRS